jgi:hypothetical protein
LREPGDEVILPSSGWANRCVSIYTRVIKEEERGKRFKRLHIGACIALRYDLSLWEIGVETRPDSHGGIREIGDLPRNEVH